MVKEEHPQKFQILALNTLNASLTCGENFSDYVARTFVGEYLICLVQIYIRPSDATEICTGPAARVARRPRVGTASGAEYVYATRACGMAMAVLAQCHPPSLPPSLLPSLAATHVASSPWIPAYCDSEGLQ